MSTPGQAPAVSSLARTVFRTAAAFTFMAVVMGSVVCASESGFECGTWPGCSDNALLPQGPVASIFHANPWIEIVHRASAIPAGVFALVCAVWSLWLRGVPRVVKVLPWVAVAGALVAGYVGRGIVLGVVYPMWVGAADLASAVLAMASMTTAAVALGRTPARTSIGAPARYAWGAFGVLLTMHVVSLYAAGKGSYTRCLSWPVWQILSADAAANPVAAWTRFGLAGVALVLVVLAVRAGVREASLRRSAVAVAVCLAVVLAFGLVIRLTGSTDLGVPYSVATVALLWSLVLLASAGTFAAASGVSVRRPVTRAASRGR